MAVSNFDYEEIPGWCAGIKVSDVNRDSIHKTTFQDILAYTLYKERYSCVVISANEAETEVLEWLKKEKFRRGPMVKNYIHGGRKTWLFFRNVTKRDFDKHCG